MRRVPWGRLGRLEAPTDGHYRTLALPNGTTVRYPPDVALAALHAAIGQTDHPLLGALLEAGTTEGMPGLCRALVGSRDG